MSDVRQLYFRALLDFDHGAKFSSEAWTNLSRALSGLPSSELIAIHRECLLQLTANVEPEDALRYYEQSMPFLQRLVACCAGSALHAAAVESVETRLGEDSSILLKRKYENVLQQLDCGILLFDPAGFLTFINLQMCRMLGLPRTALLGRNLAEIALYRKIPREVRRQIVHLYRDMLRCRVPYHEITDSNGRHLLITAVYGDRMDGDLLISVKDITEFKQIEQFAYQNDKLAILGRISAAIAHEIRNPLTSVRGFFQLMQPELKKLGKGDYASIMLGEVDRANEIISTFLNASKPTAPMKQAVQVHALLDEVALLFEGEALIGNCLIETERSAIPLEVWVDEKQIKQVLLNLVKNAMEAASGRKDGPGVIRLWAEKENPYARIYVQDNGNGMEPATLSRLFDPFFTTKQEGTGLGLAVSYRIIKNHGGRIDVRSKVGEGTTLMVALPLR